MTPANRSIEINAQLRAVLATDPIAAIALANTHLGQESNADCRAACAGLLVDAGVAAHDPGATRTGLAAILKLAKADSIDGRWKYMLGTAYLALAAHDPTPRPTWFEATHRHRLRARRHLWEAAVSDLPAEMRATAWINLGNDLSNSGRWIEAYTAYHEALRADPENPIAAGWVAVMLRRQLRGKTGTPGNWEPLAHHWARISQRDLPRVARTADGAELIFADLPTERADEVVLHPPAGLSAYEAFVYRERLYLFMAVDGTDHPDCWDSIGTPTLIESVTAPVEPTPLIAMINTCKADYLLARRLTFEAAQTDRSDAHHYTNTLDYAGYGQRSAMTLLAMRAALDVLDRIAVAANQYFDIGLRPSDVHFRSVWREQVTGQPLRLHVLREIEARNWGVLGLIGLADDLQGLGWLQGRQHLRNLATHRFVVAHDMLVGGWRECVEIEHMALPDLEDAALQSLRIARSGLLYFIGAVRMRENRNRGDRLGTTIGLPRLGG